MPFTFKATAAESPNIDEGVYDADFDGCEEGPEGQFGPSMRWNFTAYIEGEPEKVSGLTSTSSSVKSKAFKFLAAIIGRQPGVDEEIDLDALIGTRCKVLIEDNKNGWPTVTDVKVAKAK